MTNIIKIMLVDDHQLVRESLQILLDKEDYFHVVALCKNGREAIEKAEDILPDIILMDINMSPVDGFEATERIVKTIPSAKIIGLSANNNPKYAVKILEHGAKGFVTKTSSFTEMVIAIEKVYNGETYICNEIKKRFPGNE